MNSIALCSLLASLILFPPTPTPSGATEPQDLVDAAPLMYWPIPALNEAQIAAVQACDIDELVDNRYPRALSLDDLPSAAEMESDCDLAVLLSAYAVRVDRNETPDFVRNALSQLITKNYGFLLEESLIYQYLGRVPLMPALPLAQQKIKNIYIKYKLFGHVRWETEYEIFMIDASGYPRYDVIFHQLFLSWQENDRLNLNYEIDTTLTQALGPSLTDFIPVASETALLPFGEHYSQYTLSPVTDYYPSWIVTLTFEDDSTLDLVTRGNLLAIGGPWFTTIDGQTYMQYSADFSVALSALVREIGLPFGGAGAETPYWW